MSQFLWMLFIPWLQLRERLISNVFIGFRDNYDSCNCSSRIAMRYCFESFANERSIICTFHFMHKIIETQCKFITRVLKNTFFLVNNLFRKAIYLFI